MRLLLPMRKGRLSGMLNVPPRGPMRNVLCVSICFKPVIHSTLVSRITLGMNRLDQFYIYLYYISLLQHESAFERNRVGHSVAEIQRQHRLPPRILLICSNSSSLMKRWPNNSLVCFKLCEKLQVCTSIFYGLGNTIITQCKSTFRSIL